jgi:hypothetical protein
MKPTCRITLVSLAAFVGGHLFVDTLIGAPASAAVAHAASTAQLNWQAGARTDCSTERLATEWITNAATGDVASRQHRYIEVGTGLNYRDQSGKHQESKDLIELSPDGGAEARQGAYKVRFAPNINSVGAVTTTTPSNRAFKTHILGLYYYDAASGKSALISGLRNSTGALLPPNQIIYTNVFETLRADVRLTYTRAATESDLILLERPKPPEAYGLSSGSTRLELWHEFLNLEAPRRNIRVLQGETNAAVRATMVEPDLVEEILNFGDIWFPQGQAFLTLNDTDRSPDKPATVTVPSSSRNLGGLLTAKRWLTVDNRNVLIESVPWVDIKSQLAELPEMASATFTKDKTFVTRQLPPRRNPGDSPTGTIRVAKTSYNPRGYVLDYIEVPASGDFAFEYGNTYYVSSLTYFSGTLSFQQGCTIKYASGTYLLTYGSTTFDTSFASTVFTSKDEDGFGETLPNSTHVPTYAASPALWFYFVDQPLVSGVQVRWASAGIYCDWCDSSQTIADSDLEFCVAGIGGSTCGVTLNNVVKCSVLYGGDGMIDLCGPDGDGNGLPDLYEYEHFGTVHVDPNADPDGDGVSTLTEYRQGRNPAVAGTASDANNVIKLQVFTPLK